MISWKVVVTSGAVAVVLSLLTGVISGVSFGTLLFRAFIWGVIFCGIGVGASYLISKFLPELFAPATSGGKKENRPEPSNVDIVLPDENPHSGAELNFGEESHGDTTDSQEGSDEEYFSPADAEPEPPPRTRRSGDELIEEVEETEGEITGASGTGRSSSSVSDDQEAAEELPSLDGDEVNFGVTDEQDRFGHGGVSDVTSITSRGSTVDVLGHAADTEEIAKAIRTAINRDQKG